MPLDGTYSLRLWRASAIRAAIYPRSVVERPPTDFELLKAIYARHRNDYASTDPPTIVVPVDVPAIARDLGVEPNSVVGRLYHHLDPLYGERPEDAQGRARKFLFTLRAGDKINCVNFPLLEAALAGLWQQRRRDFLAVVTAVFSLGVAVASLIISALI